MTWQYAGDAIFSHFYAQTFTILLWRGAWVVMDGCFQNIDYIWIHIICLTVGYGLTFSTLLLDPVLLFVHKTLMKKWTTTGRWRHLVAMIVWEDVICVVSFWAHFFLWRGAWVLNTLYVFSDPETGGWFNNVVGTLGFCVFNLFSIVGSCGCSVDGKMDDETDRWFSTHYLSNLIQDINEVKVE